MASKLILFLSFFLLSFSSLYLAINAARSEHEIKLLYEGWLVENNKNYNDLFEKEKRYNIFKDNLKYIDEHNAGNHSYNLTLNVFADLTNDEHRNMYLGFQSFTGENMDFKESNRYLFNGDETLPDSIDWRDMGAVVGVKNQLECGSCWAFSAIAAIEGLNKIVTGTLISLSEQELVDCVRKSCQGWLMTKAFEFIIKNGGIDAEEDYPYRGYYAQCNRNKLRRTVVSIDGYENVPHYSEDSMKKAAAHQPISVAIDSSSDDFRFYGSGIYKGSCGTKLDHGVTLVGYGSENGDDYWIIKNSWGTKWGENGYVRIQRNSGTAEGKCGIAILPSYPVKNNHNLLEEKALKNTHGEWSKTEAEGKIATA
ncbi:Actinidain protein [Dioscorea alata]|uniref:Actinidain protein n=1 Tax=Dioscorea alata TaxID=55571 RepID=A0ACB7VDI0_DIOAL|nr:Actinidain protein [Dioscorea alata]